MRFAACLFLVCLPAAAQFRSNSRLVIVPATVQDRSGQPIDGLSASQFIIDDNGAKREVTLDVTFLPISLAVVVQTSNIAAPALKKVNRIGSMLEPLLTGAKGSAGLIAFGPAVNEVEPLTGDFPKIQAALAALKPRDEGSKVNDAVSAGIKMHAKEKKDRRRVLLLICDGKDSGSETKLEDLVTEAQRENVLVYALTFSRYASPFTMRANELPQTSGFNLLAIFTEIGRAAKTSSADSLAKYTGGRRASFLKQSGLEEAINSISAEIHSQYLLSFTAPADAGADFHRISVTVPSRPDAAIRARPGYWQEGL